MSQAPQPNGGEQVAQQLDVKMPVQMQYLLYLPDDYEAQDDWPLVLFLHGAGERGDNIDLVKVHGPPKLAAEKKKYPFIVVSPQCPKGKWWEAMSLIALLDDMQARYKVDPDRVYVTGLSMGGFGTWSLAAYAPERFAAAAPICGGGQPFLIAQCVKSMPIWAFHGEVDRVVPVQLSKDIVSAIEKQQGNAKLTVYEGVGHDSWTQTYDDPKFYEWLLSHRRAATESDE